MITLDAVRNLSERSLAERIEKMSEPFEEYLDKRIVEAAITGATWVVVWKKEFPAEFDGLFPHFKPVINKYEREGFVVDYYFDYVLINW